MLILFSAALMTPGPAIGQVAVDSSDVNVRQPNPEQMAAYKEDPAFVYDNSEPETSFIGMLIREVVEYLDGALGEGRGSIIIRGFFIVVLTGVIFLIVNQIMKGSISSALSGRSASEEIRFRQDSDRQIGEDLNRLIETAAKAGNYRGAVRYVYQKALKDLSRAGLIEWASYKTNIDYQYEVEAHSFSNTFRRLTRIYEYTEYGDFEIDQAGFDRVRGLYNTISRQLGRGTNG